MTKSQLPEWASTLDAETAAKPGYTKSQIQYLGAIDKELVRTGKLAPARAVEFVQTLGDRRLPMWALEHDKLEWAANAVKDKAFLKSLWRLDEKLAGATKDTIAGAVDWVDKEILRTAWEGGKPLAQTAEKFGLPFAGRLRHGVLWFFVSAAGALLFWLVYLGGGDAVKAWCDTGLCGRLVVWQITRSTNDLVEQDRLKLATLGASKSGFTSDNLYYLGINPFYNDASIAALSEDIRLAHTKRVDKNISVTITAVFIKEPVKNFLGMNTGKLRYVQKTVYLMGKSWALVNVKGNGYDGVGIIPEGEAISLPMPAIPPS